MKVGDTVQIWHYAATRPISSGEIGRISPTGKRVTARRPNRNSAEYFYKKANLNRYVESPGSGPAVWLLNDHFVAD